MTGQRKQFELQTVTLDRHGSCIARGRLLSLDRLTGIVVGSGMQIEATLGDELSARLRFQVEQAIAASIGENVETASDGTVEKEIPF